MAVEQQAVIDALKEHLEEKGYSNVQCVTNPSSGVTGPDATAEKDGKGHAFECIGYSNKGSKRSRDFYNAIWQVLGRLDNYDVVVLCLPRRFQLGMKTRIENRRSGWKALGDAFKERLYLWYW
ncbi:hypothetical protein KAU45_03930, partial [bacterium]|nr:hypothetical protein [bacterium]